MINVRGFVHRPASLNPRRLDARSLLILTVCMLGVLSPGVRAAVCDDRDQIARRTRELQGERAALQRSIQVARSAMAQALQEAKRLQPKIDAAKTKLDRCRDSLSAARAAQREAIARVRQQIASHPEIQHAQRELAEAQAERDRVRSELVATLNNDPDYLRVQQTYEDAEQRIAAAKASGDSESLAKASRELIEAGTLLHSYTEVRLLESEPYRKAFENLAAAESELRTSENRAENDIAQSGILAPTGQEVGRAETAWRAASDEVAGLRGDLNRAKSIYNNADRRIRTATAQIARINNRIADLNR